MLVWRKILAHGLKRLATPALHLWRIRHGLVEELALCIKSLATPGVHQGSALSPLLFAIVVDVITENARKIVVNEFLYADDRVLMSETMKNLKEKFWKWKDSLESKGLKVNTRKTK